MVNVVACTGQNELRCVPHLVLWVRVRPAAGTVNSKEVLTVLIQTVELLLLLKVTDRGTRVIVSLRIYLFVFYRCCE